MPLPDGTVAQVKLDFETLERLSEEARVRWDSAEPCSTVPPPCPTRPSAASPRHGNGGGPSRYGVQNIVYDSPPSRPPLRTKSSIPEDGAGGETEGERYEEQFLYKTRKKGFGPFKRELWDLPEETLSALGRELENQFAFLFGKLKMNERSASWDACIRPVDVPLKKPAGL